MTKSSARPDHLRRYAADTSTSVTRARRAADEAAVAVTRSASSGGDAHLAIPAVLAARVALDRMMLLATATRRIGVAFAAADRGAGAGTIGGVTTAGDVSLSRSLQAHAGGIADDELLGPARFAAGKSFADSLRGLSLGERLRRLAAADQADGHGPAFAAGVIQTLGAGGLVALTEEVRTRYETADHMGLTEADAGLDALGALFQDAGRTIVPVTDPAGLAASMASGSSGRTAYDLDLGLLRTLGRSAAGRNTLRQLVLNAPDLSAPIVVTIAQAIARPHRVDLDRPENASHKLLDDRQARRWDLAAPELPILILLARDPLAAWAWDESRPGGASPLAGYLPHRGPEESDELARILDSVLLESVRQGWSRAHVTPVTKPPGGGSTYGETAPASLPEVIVAAGKADPTPTLTRALAAVIGTHPDAFREIAAEALYRDSSNPTLTAYFQVLSADRDALATATANALDAYHREAVKEVAKLSQVGVELTDFTSGLVDSHRVLQDLERGAIEAGKHHNVVLGLVVSATAYGAGKALRHAATALSPVAGFVVGKAGSAGVDAAEKAAIDKWVDTQDGRGVPGATASARTEPYLVARAMAQDATWSEFVVDPDALLGLNLIQSAEDRQAFLAWIGEQPDVVRDPIVKIIQLNEPPT